MKKLVLIIFVIGLAFPCLAQSSDYESQIAQDYGPEYFFAIQGEIQGQAAPGVKSVKVNGKNVAIGKDLRFNARVTLAEGQKYLVIETLYQGLRFTKKYLVIRHPKAPKVFKLNIPQTEFKKIITRKKPVRRRIVRKPKPKPKPKPQPKGSFGFKEREFKNTRYSIKPLAEAVAKDNYSVKLKSKPGTLKWLNELLRTPNFYDIWKKHPKSKGIILSDDVKRLIKETAGYRNKPWNKLTRAQQLKIIRLNRLLLEATYPLLCPKSSLFGVTVGAENWLGFEFVAEIAPQKMLIVRRVDGKFYAAIYDLKTNFWIPLQEISSSELSDLLDEGTVPLYFDQKE